MSCLMFVCEIIAYLQEPILTLYRIRFVLAPGSVQTALHVAKSVVVEVLSLLEYSRRMSRFPVMAMETWL